MSGKKEKKAGKKGKVPKFTKKELMSLSQVNQYMKGKVK